MHAFITTANINAKARDTLNETNLAENLMEEFNDASIEEMMTKYAGVEDANGRVVFERIDHALLNSDIDADVMVDVTLDPSNYTAENEKNLVDLKTITSSDSAIYSMPQGYDENVYEIFESNSNSAHTINPSVYSFEDKDFFEENLDRTIYVSIIKTGDAADGTPLVRVELSIIYEWRGAEVCLESGDRRYTTDTKELFDNSQSEIALNSLYMMFIPRYEAVLHGHDDDIRILNYSNIPAEAFVVRQTTPEDASFLTGYEGMKGANITVTENNVNIPFTVDTVSALQLRTNMHVPVVDSNDESNPADLTCDILYRNQGAERVSTNIAREILNVTALDGKTLDNTAARNRIYKMTIDLYTEEVVAGSVVKEYISTMSGTKIE